MDWGVKILINIHACDLGRFWAIQEGAEGLEEPKQVVYKENDFGSTVRNSSETVNDSEESTTEGSRSNLLEINGW